MDIRMWATAAAAISDQIYHFCYQSNSIYKTLWMFINGACLMWNLKLNSPRKLVTILGKVEKKKTAT